MPASNLRGVLTMVAAVAAFSVLDVTMKRLVEFYPAMQVTFMRGAASLPFLFGATALFGRWSDLVPRRWQLHLVRGLLSVWTLWFFIYAVSKLSLADAYAIFMSAPLLITALSGPMLGEHVGWQRWLAVLTGLAGVLIVLQPTGSSFATIGGLAAIASAVGYALSVLTIRILGRTDTSAATVTWSLVLLTIISGLLATGVWKPVAWEHWAWIAGMGLSGALGQYLITEAFRRAPAPVIAPIEYTALAWGMLFDWLLWMTFPSGRMLTGAAIIVASGLYVIHRERLGTAAQVTAPH